MQFVTQFGVVEVVKDDRAIPTGDIPDNLLNQVKSYQAAKPRVESQNAKVMTIIAANSRVRRSNVNKLYQNGQLTKKSMFDAYFDGDPSHKKQTKQILLTQPLPKDPALPDNFCPDRIIECILVPDTRGRFFSDGETSDKLRGEGNQGKSPTRLFLQRKLLKDRYNGELPVYECRDCGRHFATQAGVKYHAINKACIQKNAVEGQKRRDREESIEVAAKAIASDKQNVLEMLPRNAAGKSDKRKKRKKIRPKPMYPEVLISLGFKVVKADMEFSDDLKLPALVGWGSEAPDTGGDSMEVNESEVLGDLSVDEPGALLEHLQKRFQAEKREYERIAANQKHGSMYKGVFKSLGFKKPRRKRGQLAEPGRRRHRRRLKPARPPPPPKPLPPIIDTSALADEVDSGRFPSMKRNHEDNHGNVCALCKTGGELVCCDFCTNAEHLKCIRKRFTVKDPEPEDDFMCHKCISFLLARRKRAEGRRLKKQQRDDQQREEEDLEASQLNPGMQKGKEYHYMAARGQEVSEMVEMLLDAQTRLKQALATSKMNNVRRKAMGCFYAKN